MTESCQNKYVCEAAFRMSKGDFARKMARFWGLTPGLLLLLVFVFGLVAGMFLDIRYLIVSAMAVFILLPMVMMFLYYYHGLGKNCYFNIVDHNISINEGCLEITMYFPVVSLATETDEESADAKDVETRVSKLTINYNDILNYRVFSDCVVYPVGKPMSGFVWLPLSAFNDADSFRNTVALLSSKLK